MYSRFYSVRYGSQLTFDESFLILCNWLFLGNGYLYPQFCNVTFGRVIIHIIFIFLKIKNDRIRSFSNIQCLFYGILHDEHPFKICRK